jgi:glycosyltransferase involved in cell wall biosynthesis
MFSIIIPLYNKEKYIAKAIESVLQQTFSRFEIIVVNDGSTDNSLETVERISKLTNQQINLINQPNQGVSAARNNGVKAASFDYIAFLDADDWWHPDFLKSLKELTDDFPDAGIYASAYYTIKNGKSKQSVFGLRNNYKGYLNYFTAYSFAWWMPLTSISVVIPKEIYVKQQGFKESLKFGEDVDLWLRISLASKIAFINKPLAYYNQDVDLKSRALGGKIWNPEHHYIFNLEYLKQEEDNNSELKKLIDGLRVRALLRYYLSGKYQSHTMPELKKVDFKNQPLYFRRIYKYPRFAIKVYFRIKLILSFIKQKLIVLTH